MDLLSDGGITIDSQILEPLKWGALQDNVIIKMGAIFARFSNQPDDDNDIVRASPEDSFFASRFKHSQNIEISCIPDTDVLDETAISKTSSVEELSKTFIPETERYTER